MKKIYLIKDLIEEKFVANIISENDKEAVRRAVIGFGNNVPIRDLEIYEGASFDEKLGLIEGKKEIRKIEWNIYSIPEDKEEAVEILK